MQRIRRIVALLGLAFAGAAHAEDLNLQDLDQRLKIAERKLELSQEAGDAAKKADAVITAGPGGFVISSADKKFSLKLGGLLQADSRNYFGDDLVPQVNDILVRRARLINNAVLGERLKLTLVAELAGASASLVDAYADLKLFDFLSARVGRFKTPISLENVRSDPARDFVEAGFAYGLATVRDNGAWLELADGDQAISLGAGVFDGGADGATVAGDVNDDKEAVAKLFIHPTRFADTVVLRDFGFGIAGSSGHRSPGTATTTYKTTGQQTLAGYKALTTVQDESLRVAPQAYLFSGPLSVLAEYVRSTDFATNTTNAAGFSTGILGREAWQVSAGWVLTGEDAAFGGLKWNKESTGDWGVWQLVGRYQEFQFDGGNFHEQPRLGANTGVANQRFLDPRKTPTKVQGWGVGLNWIPLANAKLYLDLEQNLFTDGAVTGSGAAAVTSNKETENVLFVRTQFTY